MKIAIYAIFNRRGNCLYVGATRTPANRFSVHRKTFGRNKLCRVLRWTTARNARRIESQVILAYKLKGQAKHNYQIGPAWELKLGRAILALEPAPSFWVSTAEERQTALRFAQGLGKRVVTRKTKNGFQVIALE